MDPTEVLAIYIKVHQKQRRDMATLRTSYMLQKKATHFHQKPLIDGEILQMKQPKGGENLLRKKDQKNLQQKLTPSRQVPLWPVYQQPILASHSIKYMNGHPKHLVVCEKLQKQTRHPKHHLGLFVPLYPNYSRMLVNLQLNFFGKQENGICKTRTQV